LSQSASTGEGSVLSRALDAPEYPGRVRGKGHGVTPTSFYKSPRRRNPSNEEVLQKLAELQAQVSELQRDKEAYMREKCNTSSVKETSDKASINYQRKFPEVIIIFFPFKLFYFINDNDFIFTIGLGHFILPTILIGTELSTSWQGKSAQHFGRFTSP
jgi:hypothetical protein